METQPQISFTDPQGQLGFRLDRLEIFNWGTFSGRHELRANSLTALLTGPNGSGKSTLVDALLTLLVPQRMGRNYNMASGAKKKRERTERSYVLGIWGEKLVAQDAAAVEAEKLREPGVPSILLAVFKNAATAQVVTLAQVLWIHADEVHHAYIVTSDERSIRKDFQSLGDTKKLRQTLAHRGMEPLASFDAYAETFCRRVHLSFPSGLALFNTVVSIKETGEVAQFIRDYMLNRLTTIEQSLNDAHTQMEDLERCNREIETAKLQLKLLLPVAEHNQAVVKTRAALSNILHLQDGLPKYCASIYIKQAEARIKELEGDVGKIEQALQVIEQHRGVEQKNLEHAITALAGLPESQQIEQLNTRIKAAEEKKDLKEAARGRFDIALREAGLRELVRSHENFHAVREKALARRKASQGAFEDAIRKESELRRQAALKRQEERDRLLRANELRTSRTHMPNDLLRIRERVVHETGIPINRLPFAGEIIQVRPEMSQWRPVVEVLLRKLGRTMLVEEQDYRILIDFIYPARINGLIDFKLVAALPVTLADPKPGDHKHVIELLNLKPDHPLRGALADEIRRHYPHTCCADKDEFRRTEWAIATDMVIRHGKADHRKDDRKETIDPEKFVLGWNNEELVKTLVQRAAADGEQAKALEEQANKTANNKLETSNTIEALDTVLSFTSFDQINAAAELKDIESMQKARTNLHATNNRLHVLEEARQSAQNRLEELKNEEVTAKTKITNFRAELKEITAQQKTETVRLGTDPFDASEFGERLRPYQSKEPFTLRHADRIEREIDSTLTIAYRREQSNVSNAENALTSAMNDFLNTNPEYRPDFPPKVDKAGDYLALLKRIEEEKLPELQERFRSLMNDRVVKDIALLQGKMEDSVHEYAEVIKGLNESLLTIDYNPGWYIKINCLQTKANVVAQFKADLKACLPGAVNPSDESRQKAFQKIREILTKLRENERFREFVTDTRNWLDFRVDQCSRTSEERRPISTSDSKSGGQKAKLAFTIMASAIAHQYGLLRSNAEARSFRFVVIDEIFGKTDEENSVYALKLFEKFKLQLLIVCPFTAQARVVDGYVGSYHIATNPETNNSGLMTATLEQIQAIQPEEAA